MRLTSRLILLLLLLSLCLGVPVLAQNELIDQNTINDDQYEVLYSVDVTAGQVITARTEILSGDLDTTLSLLDDSGSEIAFNDDGAEGNLSSELIYEASEDAAYTLVVSRFESSAGQTSGDYALYLSVAESGLSSGLTENEDGPLIASGSLDDETQTAEYPIDLTEGQFVVISAQAQDGDLDTVLTLIGPDGSVVAENDDIGTEEFDSELLYPVSVGGTYTIVVGRYEGTSGEFGLTVHFGEVIGSGDGALSEDNTEESFTLDLEAGFSLVAVTDTLGGELDTVLTLLDPDGAMVAVNDDWNANTLASAITYTTEAGGTYTLVVSRYEDSESTGDYTLTIASSAVVMSESLATVSNDPISLSGPAEVIETERFRIHYTLEGSDATTQDYVDAFVATLDEVYTLLHDEQGWAAPPTNDSGLFEIYVANSLGEENGNAMGFASTFNSIGDNPNTDVAEVNAAVGYLVVDNDFDGLDGDPIGFMRATTAHEFHHVIQFGYDEIEPMGWYFEATASYIETVTLVEDEDATGYVAQAFQSPEVCLGTEEDNMLWYGNWTFMEFLNDTYAEDATLYLWENIALYDNWQALEETLAAYGTDVATAHALYRAKNLVLDYDLASKFGATVWLENIITDAGTWTFNGNGVQELGANYYELQVFDAVDVTLSGADGLEVYAVGITGDLAEVMALGTAGTIDPSGYDRTYLIVVNSNYDDVLSDCAYADYSLDINAAAGAPSDVIAQFDASQFIPLSG